MTKRYPNPRARRLIASALIIMGASVAFAAEPPATADRSAPTKEMREKMATLHEQMAACLRSAKPVAECRSQMMNSCHDTMGEKGCPMMGHGMMGSGPAKGNQMMSHGSNDHENPK